MRKLSAVQRRVLKYLATSIGMPEQRRTGEGLTARCFDGNVVAMTACIRSLDARGLVKVYTTQAQSPYRAFISITPAGRVALAQEI